MLLDGLVAGAACALFVLLLPGVGEPGVAPSVAAFLTWFIVVGVMGMINAAGIYVINAWVVRRMHAAG